MMVKSQVKVVKTKKMRIRASVWTLKKRKRKMRTRVTILMRKITLRVVLRVRRI